MTKQNTIRILKAKALKIKHKKNIDNLENYHIFKYETLSKNDKVKIKFLISTLRKMQKEDLSKTSFDRFCRDNLKINVDRFNHLIKTPRAMKFEELENLILYLKTT